MALSFACALGHAPGIIAWRERAPVDQRERLDAAFQELHARVQAARLDVLVLFTAEHWANFFLDHISPWCIGTADSFTGPIEPWLKLPTTAVPGDAALAMQLMQACYHNDIEVAFAGEMQLDHGTMIPLHYLTPQMNLPIVPIVINTLAPPLPSPRRCFALGKVIGDVIKHSPQRIGLVATGGMSHDPGERNHGVIDDAFDRRFLQEMSEAKLARLEHYSIDELSAAGTGALELLTWIALAGALQGRHGEILSYEPVVPWATGIGAMAFDVEMRP